MYMNPLISLLRTEKYERFDSLAADPPSPYDVDACDVYLWLSAPAPPYTVTYQSWDGTMVDSEVDLFAFD